MNVFHSITVIDKIRSILILFFSFTYRQTGWIGTVDRDSGGESGHGARAGIDTKTKCLSSLKEEQVFIEAKDNKRTIWTVLPSLHPTLVSSLASQFTSTVSIHPVWRYSLFSRQLMGTIDHRLVGWGQNSFLAGPNIPRDQRSCSLKAETRYSWTRF